MFMRLINRYIANRTRSAEAHILFHYSHLLQDDDLKRLQRNLQGNNSDL
jgi:hypothetical protein